MKKTEVFALFAGILGLLADVLTLSNYFGGKATTMLELTSTYPFVSLGYAWLLVVWFLTRRSYQRFNALPVEKRVGWWVPIDSEALSATTRRAHSAGTTQVGHLLDLRQLNRSFSDIAGYFAFYGVGDNLLSGHGEPERLSGVPVSENFFQVLGVQPQLGRLFTAEECKWHGPKAVLLSHGLWARRFGG